MTPHQLGSGVPDGAALIINTGRAWTADIGKRGKERKEVEISSQAVMGIDMENAYGRVYMSACMEAGMKYLPRGTCRETCICATNTRARNTRAKKPQQRQQFTRSTNADDKLSFPHHRGQMRL